MTLDAARNVDGVPDASVRALTKRYPGGSVAVDSVDLDVARGEFFSLLGPSGCGKSTTLRIIAGLETLTSGDVFVRGALMNRVPAYRRPTNMVFQNLALFPHLTVSRNIAFPLRIRKLSSAEINRKVLAVLELVDLSDYGERLPSQLSGGQQQRVAIARALVNEPAVILLDEPLGALDLRLREHMQAALKQIHRDSRTTFIYVTHDQNEAFTMSDRVAIMDRGKLLQVGPPAEVYARPANEFVARFVGDTNLLRGNMVGANAFSCEGATLSVTGSSGLFSLRPEAIGLSEPGARPANDNQLDAVVEEMTFLGQSVRYRVQITGARLTLVVVAANASGVPLFDSGSPVQVNFPVSAAVPIKEEK